MDRLFAYAGAIPQDTDVLSTNKNVLYGLGHMIQAALGTTTSVVGLVGAQSTIPDLHITIGPGAIYSSQTVDATAYGDLGTDANTVMKQGILKAAQTLTLTAPITSGYSQVYLVEATYSDTDGGATVLPYYNSSNPAAPYAGPANAGTSNYTVRQGLCTITLKAGTAAPTGSQTTPSTDAGYVPLYTITMANGQTAITTAQIVPVATAPFVPANLVSLPGFIQSGAWIYGVDTGAVNAAIVALSPPITALTVGMQILVKFIAANTSTTPTLNLNGLGAKTIVKQGGSAPVAGDISGWVPLLWDGAYFRIDGMAASDAALASSAYSALTGGQAIVTTTGNFTVPAGVTLLKRVRVWAAGGGGGSANSTSSYAAAAGGAGGQYAERTNIAVTPGAVIACTVPAGGAGGTSGGAGVAGATASFGAYISCGGGGGGLGGVNAVATTASTGGSGGSGGTFSVNGFAGSGGIGVSGGGGGGGGGAFSSGSSPGGAINGTAFAGSFPGGGGSGTAATAAAGAFTGGAGSAALIIVEY